MHASAIGQDQLLTQNQYGWVCLPRSSTHTYTSQALLAGRVHEPTTIEYLLEHHGGEDIVHAGAGFGDFLPALGKACSGKIWAFEPNLENYRSARKTIELNGLTNIVLQNLALGAQPGAAQLRVMDGEAAMGPRSEICDGETVLAHESQPCEIRTLDELLPEAPVAIIHLDIEGYEFEALRGAAGLIARCRPLIVLEIDGRALDYNRFMASIDYRPVEQLIYNAGEMVFVNTVYAPLTTCPETSPST